MAEQFDQTFYEEHIWGAVEINLARKGIDTLKLERLIESCPDWHNLCCLEVGCGAGRYLRGLGKMIPKSAQLAGTDISTTSIEIAQRIPGTIEYRLMQPDKIPWEDQTFDVVCFLDVLEHIEEPVPFLAESLRVLKIGGVLHASVPLEGDIRSLWRWFDFIGLHNRTKRTDGQIQRFTRESLKAIGAQFAVTLEQEHYSYHLIGNVLDITLFTLLNIRRALGFKGSHYDMIQSSRRNNDSFLAAMSTLAESSMYIEGRLLGNYPGPNAHFSYRRLA